MGTKEIHNDLGGLGPVALNDTVKEPPVGMMIPKTAPQIRVGSIGSTWYEFDDQVATTATVSASVPSRAVAKSITIPCKWMAPWHIHLYRGIASELMQGTFRLERFYGQGVQCHDSEGAARAAGGSDAFQLNFTGLNSTTNPKMDHHDSESCNWIAAFSWGTCSSDGEEIGPVPSVAHFLMRDPNAIQEGRMQISNWTTGRGQVRIFVDLVVANTSRYVPQVERFSGSAEETANGLRNGILEIGLRNLRPSDMSVPPLLEQEIGRGNAAGLRLTLAPSCCTDADCTAYYSYLHWLPGGSTAYPDCVQTDPLRGVIADTGASDTATRSKCYWCPDWVTSAHVLADSPRMDALGTSSPYGRPYFNWIVMILGLSLRHRLLELRIYDLDNVDESDSTQELLREFVYFTRAHGFGQPQPYGKESFQTSASTRSNPVPRKDYANIYEDTDSPCPEPRIAYNGPIVSNTAESNKLQRSYIAQMPAFSQNVSSNPFVDLFLSTDGLLPPTAAGVSSSDGWHCPADGIPGVSASTFQRLGQLYDLPTAQSCSIVADQPATPPMDPEDGTIARNDAALADLYVRSNMYGIYEDNVGAQNSNGEVVSRVVGVESRAGSYYDRPEDVLCFTARNAQRAASLTVSTNYGYLDAAWGVYVNPNYTPNHAGRWLQIGMNNFLQCDLSPPPHSPPPQSPPQSPTPPLPPVPPAPPPRCEGWCADHTRPWRTVCTFVACGGCSECFVPPPPWQPPPSAPLPPAEPPEVPPSAPWPERPLPRTPEPPCQPRPSEPPPQLPRPNLPPWPRLPPLPPPPSPPPPLPPPPSPPPPRLPPP
eukprot:7062718-Prymnesium_polylepis.1